MGGSILNADPPLFAPHLFRDVVAAYGAFVDHLGGILPGHRPPPDLFRQSLLGEIGDIGGRAASIHDRGSKQDQAAEFENKPYADLKEDRLPELLCAVTSQALKAGAAESGAVVEHALVLVVGPESHNGVHGHQDGECYSDGREAVGCHVTWRNGARSGGERNGPGAGECLPEPCEHHEVRMNPHAVNAARAEPGKHRQPATLKDSPTTQAPARRQLELCAVHRTLQASRKNESAPDYS